ncbi:MAG: hypothetical protein HRU15_17800 [Planctomycetes bacterium]|nr:hypothetical protein [Planctomycetota bacterium]
MSMLIQYYRQNLDTQSIIRLCVCLCIALLLFVSTLSLSAEDGVIPDEDQEATTTLPVTPTITSATAVNVQAEIAALSQEVKQLQDAGRHQDARMLMDKILQLMPNDITTKKALRKYGVERQDAAFDYHVQQQLLTVEAHSHLLRAEHLAEKKLITKALVELDVAQNLHSRIEGGLSGDALQRLQDLQQQLVVESEQQSAEQREEARLDNQQTLVEQVEAKSRRVKNIFDQRLLRITTLVKKGLYEEALSYCRNLVRDYPGDGVADAMFLEVLNLSHEQRALSYKEKIIELKKEIQHQQHDSLRPKAWDGWPVFADDWQDRIENRDVSYYEVTLPDWQLELANKLKERMDVNFEDMDIGDALDFLSSRLGVNIVVDPDIRSDGMTVSINARNMTTSNILNWLAEQVDSQWQYFNEAVYFGAEQESEVIIRIYDVSQVIFVPQDFPGIVMELSSDQTGGGGSLFADDAFADDSDGVAPEDLIDLLQETVDPLGWEDHDDWGITIRGTVLMVTTTANTHLLIQDFINALRDTNDIQVNISAKWLTISDNFMEEIGINWQNDGGFPGLAGPGLQPGRAHSEHEYTGNVNNVLPGTAMELAQSVVGKGLNLHLAFLGAVQALGIFEAVEARQKGRILEHIDLTVKNGSRANAFIGRSVAYIGDYDVETGTGGTGFTISRLDPVISVLNVGATMDIKPFVSSDRKYVTLDLKPDFARVSFNIADIVALQPYNLGGNTVLLVDQYFPLELPVIRMNRVRTRVMIPDRGTVLVGGFKKHLEQNSYAQIPVLGNIPFIGRIFGRRGIYESRESLYLSVGAKIILYPELEALQ